MAVKFEKKGDGAYMLDVCGYVCPHPQIYAKKSMEKIASGDTLDVVFDNPSSGETIVQMCEQLGNEVLDKKQDGGKFIYVLKKG
jgi:tRNA 2-thiouridine synthesizing protein A